ncbi:MAG: DUF3137 domain-containing protein [Planctomycetes bacterium]|nr:DUF3137 domain-containing protein [Planctomycetota bacterium]
MKTLEELKEFYANDLSTDLQQLEAKRKRVMQNTLIAVGVLIVLGLIGFGVMVSQDAPRFVFGFVLITGVAIGTIIFYLIGKSYKREFKQCIIGRIVQFIEPSLIYRPEDYIDESIFKSSKLFTHSIDLYNGEDLVRGRVDKTNLMFSELHAQYETGSGKNKTWHTLFKGLFFIADFNKHFRGQTVVLPDTAEKLFGGLGKMLQSWNVSRADLIKLEDPEFEKEFVVYADDQIEARYILSTSLMQRILDFKKKTGTKIHLSFTGSKVYVAVPMTKNMFEPKYFSSVGDFSPILDYYRDLSFAAGIVDDLNLNTRIWTKE